MELQPLGPPQQLMPEGASLKEQKKECLKKIKNIVKEPREYADPKRALKECQLKATEIDPEFGQRISTILSKCKIASSNHKANKEVVREIKKEIKSLEPEKRVRDEDQEQLQEVREVQSEEFHEANPLHLRAWRWISATTSSGAGNVASLAGSFFRRAATFLPSTQRLSSLVTVYTGYAIHRNLTGIAEAVVSRDPVDVAMTVASVAVDVIIPTAIQLGGEAVASVAMEAISPRRPPPPALPPAEPPAPPPSLKRRKVDPNVHTLDDL